jgi:hypothetical protein
VAKKTNFEDWLITAVGIGLGLAFLYYTQTGLGKENDAALIPNTPEEEIDDLINALNRRFGKRWIEFGLGVLTNYVQNALPAPLVVLLRVVAEVENISKGRLMTGYEKQQLALRMVS